MALLSTMVADYAAGRLDIYEARQVEDAAREEKAVAVAIDEAVQSVRRVRRSLRRKSGEMAVVARFD